MHQQMEQQKASLDSSTKNLNEQMEHASKSYDSTFAALQAETNNRNLNSFMADMKEREQKEKQRMWLRIGLGLFFLIILIIGLKRKGKVKK